MIDSLLLVFLGSLSAGLVALMLAPVLWRHAVQLTTKRVHGSTPLSLADIQADKDQLRAEFAVTARKLEIAAEQWQGRAAALQIELAKVEQLAANAESDSEAKSLKLEDAQEQIASLTSDLDETRDDLTGTQKSLRETNNRLVEQRAKYDAQARQLNDANLANDERKVELVALKTQLANLNDKLARVDEELELTRRDRDEAREALNKVTAQAKDRAARIDSLQDALAARDKTIDALRLRAGQKDADERALTVAGGNGADGKNHPKSELEVQLAQLRDKLEREIAAEKVASEKLREQLSDVAAKVVGASMSADDKMSKAIESILQASETSHTAAGNGAPVALHGDGKSVSLAERIRTEANPPS